MNNITPEEAQAATRLLMWVGTGIGFIFGLFCARYVLGWKQVEKKTPGDSIPAYLPPHPDNYPPADVACLSCHVLPCDERCPHFWTN